MPKEARKAYLEAIRERYKKSSRRQKSVILSEFCQVCVTDTVRFERPSLRSDDRNTCGALFFSLFLPTCYTEPKCKVLQSCSRESDEVIKEKYIIQTDITLNAPQEAVWKALSSFDSYHLWNSFIPIAKGQALEGSKVTMTIHVPTEAPQKYLVRIKESVPQKKLTWVGHFKIKGLIDGHHSFELIAVDDFSTQLKHYESFSGILVPFVWRTFLSTKLRQGFLNLNQDLKSYLENN